MTTFTPTIGIEVHAELSTKSKMFCGCANAPHDSEPNTHVCPVCLAHPGTLPTVNEEAVKKILMVGAAIGGTIATYSEFDRKNYFYPDIPKAYQISQYQFPFVKGGELAGVAITRVHLEEDTARSLHDQTDGSVVDFNRAGVPLMELVTEPVIHDAATAGRFARELQLLLRTLGVSNANMERGEMRVEANISVSATDRLGTKVEVKNLNSFKAVEAAIAYEIERQTSNISAVISETRGWDEQKQVTFSQRSKETAEDYRYFPDPDIPRFDLEKAENISISRIKENLPRLPDELRLTWKDRGIADEKVELLVLDPVLGSYAEAATEELNGHQKAVELAVNYLISDITGILQQQGDVDFSNETAPQFASLVRMAADGLITSRVAKDLLLEVVFQGKNPKELAEERGLLQQNSADDLRETIERVLAEHPSVADDYRNGKEAALQFLVGQGMKMTKGAANPELLKTLLKEELK